MIDLSVKTKLICYIEFEALSQAHTFIYYYLTHSQNMEYVPSVSIHLNEQVATVFSRAENIQPITFRRIMCGSYTKVEN